MRKSFYALVFLALCPLLAAQQTLNNDSIEKLVKAGLSDDLIVSTVNASPGTYDTSADGLIALKKAGASDKVISAVLMKASGVTPAASGTAAGSSTPAITSGLPAGIDDVGVYYKDKSGAWTPLMPEIVNFKTGGVLKSVATIGIVKGDMNGHMVGAHAKTILSLPVVFAVYVPEGTAITEYQLLRFRPSADAREFRSTTGGVMHSSGGAERDVVDFHPEKIAPRVYQVTLQGGAGKGEYGLLPPGGNGGNMGSSGKIYSVSITE